DRRIGSVRVEAAGVELRHLAPGGQPRRRHVFPGLAAVAGDVDQAVVGAGPDGAAVAVRRGYGVDDAAARLVRQLRRAETADAGGRLRLLARQVGADDLPAFAAGAGLEQHVAGQVEDVRVGG